MKLTLRPRQMGKTYEAILQAADTHAYLVVPTRQSAEEVAARAREMGLDINFPLTFDEFASRSYYGRGIKGFVIDNADMLLQYLSGGVPIMGATWTQDDEPQS